MQLTMLSSARFQVRLTRKPFTKANASYDLNAEKQLYYVFVFTTEDHEKALNEARRLQKERRSIRMHGCFMEAWGEGGKGEDIIIKQEPIKQPEIEPEIKKEPPIEEPPIVETPPAPVPENKTNVCSRSKN